jgi:hypothetical protein
MNLSQVLETVQQKACLYAWLAIFPFFCCSIVFFPPVYISLCLSIYLFIYLSVCISVCLSVCLSIYLSICVYIYIHICIYITCRCMSLTMCVACLCVCVCVCVCIRCSNCSPFLKADSVSFKINIFYKSSVSPSWQNSSVTAQTTMFVNLLNYTQL